MRQIVHLPPSVAAELQRRAQARGILVEDESHALIARGAVRVLVELLDLAPPLPEPTDPPSLPPGGTP